LLVIVAATEEEVVDEDIRRIEVPFESNDDTPTLWDERLTVRNIVFVRVNMILDFIILLKS